MVTIEKQNKSSCCHIQGDALRAERVAAVDVQSHLGHFHLFRPFGPSSMMKKLPHPPRPRGLIPSLHLSCPWPWRWGPESTAWWAAPLFPAQPRHGGHSLWGFHYLIMVPVSLQRENKWNWKPKTKNQDNTVPIWEYSLAWKNRGGGAREEGERGSSYYSTTNRSGLKNHLGLCHVPEAWDNV